jgi:hypothetical protein
MAFSSLVIQITIDRTIVTSYTLLKKIRGTLFSKHATFQITAPGKSNLVCPKGTHPTKKKNQKQFYNS